MKRHPRARARGAASVALLLAPCALLVGSWCAATPAAAQEDAASAEDEIVVTARRREETLSDVPVSASVIGGQAIAERNIQSLQDLTNTTPAVQLAQGTTSNRQIIRGIGSGDNPSFEQSVGTFVDDIYHGRSRVSASSIFDIDRVEILRGPQTTYFGNNAIAGALSLSTRDPGDDYAANLRAAFTPELGGYVLEAGADLPLSDTLAIRIAGQVNGGDGWIDDRAAGSLPETDNMAVRATVLWRPSDAFTARFKAQHVEDRQEGGFPVVRSGCPQPPEFGATTGFCAAAIGAGAAPYAADFERNTSPGQRQDLDSDDYSLRLDWELGGDITLTSISGYARYRYEVDQDLDLTPLPLLALQAPEGLDQLSEELRIASDTGGAFDWMAGIYYQTGDLDVTNSFGYGFLSPAISAAPAFAPLVPYLPFGVDNAFSEESTTEAVFAALTWRPTDRLELNGALRYMIVEKEFARLIRVGTGSFAYNDFVELPAPVQALGAGLASARNLAVVGTTNLEREDDHVSGSLSAEYELSANTMVYARFDHGFKAGGFNGSDLTSPSNLLFFAPETVDAYELGLKTRSSDGRLAFDIALFRSDYSDLQLSGIVPSSSGAFVNRVQNAGGAISQGVEIETRWRITDNFRTSFQLSWLDAHYTSYPNATPTALQTVALQTSQDLSGERTPFAPEWAANWTLRYEFPLTSALTFTITNQLFYKDDIYLNPNNDPYVVQDGYVREDLTLALEHQAGWEISLVGQNLTDETIRTFGAAVPTSLGTYVFMTEPPRRVTLQFSLDF
jgi:iron complex outermembrane recepter protein